jgi:hypothetical protein
MCRGVAKMRAVANSPLRRTSDRVQAVLRRCLIVLVLGSVPVGVIAGLAANARFHDLSRTQRAEWRPAVATLLTSAGTQSAQSGVSVYLATERLMAPATASWLSPDGGAATGTIAVPVDTRAGARVHIWLDQAGRPAGAPMSPGVATAYAVLIGAGLLAGTAMVSLVVWLSTRKVLDRQRFAQWDREWRELDPA